MYLFCQLYSEDGEGTNTAGRFRVETGEHDGDEVSLAAIQVLAKIAYTIRE